MKKLFPVLLLILSLSCYGGEPRRGYRGFLEWENCVGNAWHDDCSGPGVCKDAAWVTGIATSHGYQFNRHVYFGGGTFLGFGPSGIGWSLPVYANFRYDASFGRAKPYGDVRIGWDILEATFYFSPSIGYRFSVGKKSNFNIGVGTSHRRVDIWGFKHNEVYFSLRLGIDF